MEFTPVHLDFATRDLYLQKIQDQIMAKRQLLLSKQKMLNQTAKQNHFLTDVQKDYTKYYDFIIKQKQDQIRSMEIIKQYLNDIIVSGKLTNKDIYQAKKQQKDILGEIGTIKNNLNEIMSQTENLQNENENDHIE
jgi:hypothetical protein